MDALDILEQMKLVYAFINTADSKDIPHEVRVEITRICNKIRTLTNTTGTWAREIFEVPAIHDKRKIKLKQEGFVHKSKILAVNLDCNGAWVVTHMKSGHILTSSFSAQTKAKRCAIKILEEYEHGNLNLDFLEPKDLSLEDALSLADSLRECYKAVS